VDVIVECDGLKGFEVKWGGKMGGKRRILGKMKQFITLSKGTFEEEPLVTPVSAFLACLGT